MKIGVLLTVYNCDNYIDAVLEPWFKLKEKYNMVFAVNSGMFKDYVSLGIPYRNQPTLDKLSKWDFDFQVTTKGTNLLGEDDSRNTCLDYLKKQGIRIPEDISVVGFDDVAMSDWASYHLTTWHQPVDQMVEVAINLLLEQIDGDEDIPIIHRLEGHLVERGTVKDRR